MLVLGIDPGTAITGYGFVDESTAGCALRPVEFGVVRTTPDFSAAERLRQVFEDVTSLIRTCRPDAIAIEQLFFNRNVTTALAVGQARGVVILAASLAGIPVHEYTPSQVKQAVTGVGRASKAQVGYMVQALLSLPSVPTPDDVADALAVAICHHNARAAQGALARGNRAYRKG